MAYLGYVHSDLAVEERKARRLTFANLAVHSAQASTPSCCTRRATRASPSRSRRIGSTRGPSPSLSRPSSYIVITPLPSRVTIFCALWHLNRAKYGCSL